MFPGHFCAMKFQTPLWLSDFEVRLCSVVTLIFFLLSCLSGYTVLLPCLESVLVKYQVKDCSVEKALVQVGVNCSWSSCWNSCTGLENYCTQILVSSTYSDILYPLQASINGCGIEVNCELFFRNFKKINLTFTCIFIEGKQQVIPKSDLVPFSYQYIILSLVPLVLLLISFIYVISRNVFKKGTKIQKKEKPKKKVGKSFYEGKLAELERLRKEREKREMLARYNDTVRVEELETVTALVFKPSTSWINSIQSLESPPPIPFTSTT